MNQVTEHDDMLAGMHPRIDVCGRKRICGFRGAQRVPGFYRASAFRGFRGSRFVGGTKLATLKKQRIFSVGLKARRPSERKRSPTITYKHAKFS